MFEAVFVWWRIRFVNLFAKAPYYQGDKYVKSRVVTHL